MGAEFKPKHGIKNWLKSEVKKLNDVGYRQIKDIRNEIVHVEGDLASRIERDHIDVLDFSGKEPEKPSPWRFKGKEESVFDTCQRFIDLLQMMVKHCEENFKWLEEEYIILPEDYEPDNEPQDER